MYVLITTLVHFTILGLVIVRIMLRPHREPASRVAWLAVVAAIPFLGVLAYLLLGEVNIGRRLSQRNRRAIETIDRRLTESDSSVRRSMPTIPERYEPLFQVGRSVSQFDPVGGNRAELLHDSNTSIDRLIEDIDSAQKEVCVLFYIWLTDRNGERVADSLVRSAKRGVICRAMVDGLGSRGMIGSSCWSRMRDAGVRLGVALPIGNLLYRAVTGRIDLRNHRKIAVIDRRITYGGSQNCADPEFRVKPRFAPWVDVMIRWEGPIALQNLAIFAIDWMTYTNESLSDETLPTNVAAEGDVVAQVIATGPTRRSSAMPEVFESLMYQARRELVITTPYYIPNESLQDALCSAAYRGVATTLILPAKNDSWVVGGASRSYYLDLLEAGVHLYEYVGGLLHAKTLTVDGEMGLVGSANIDRRSFDLNFENNILFYSAELTDAIRTRQQEFISRSRRVERDEVIAWPIRRRLWNNTLAILGPIL
ncbi:cardiolipin synthase [bacterium]|nr:cardiolipin synthase [bacterium]